MAGVNAPYKLKVWFLGITLLQCLLLRVSAKDILKLSGFSECQSTAEIFVDHVNVEYDADSRSINFNVGGTSTKSQNVTASLKVVAYGKNIFTKDFNPCEAETYVAGLCPVPVGNIQAESTQIIPAEFASQIPSIAFSVPDIALQATIELKRLDDGTKVGCVITDLSNGKSVDSPAITYIAAGIAAAALLIGMASSVAGSTSSGSEPGESSGSSPNFSEMMAWFQTIATSGMLSVEYPPLYRSFTERFAFSTGLISWPQMQSAIDNLRSRTGGHVAESHTTSFQNATSKFPARDLLYRADTTVSSPGSDLVSNVTDTLGIGAYVEKSGIVQENAFMTVLLIACIVILAIIVSILLFKTILEIWALFGSFPKSLLGFRKRYWGTIFRTNVLLVNTFFGIWVLYCVFQFKNGDSWAATVLAAVTLALFTAVLGFFTVRIIHTARRHIKIAGNASRLFEDKSIWLKYSLFYNTYHKKSWWFFGPIIVYSFVRYGLLAALDGHGLAQTISVLVVDVLMLVLFLFVRPFERRTANVVNILIHLTRVILVGATLVFVDELKIKKSTQTITGFALVILTLVLTVLMVGLMIFNAIYTCCKDNPHRKRRKEAEKQRRESQFFLDPNHHDTSYRAVEVTDYSQPPLYVDPTKQPLYSTQML